MIFRRKMMPPQLQPAWTAFSCQAERVEQARQALLSCLPVGRVARAPVPVGLDLLRDELVAVREDVDDWRVPAIEEHWRACRNALGEALDMVDEAHRVATTSSELEDVLDAVSAVVEPLDAWGAAERAWLRLRGR